MINARDEFLEHTEGANIIAAYFRSTYFDAEEDVGKCFKLKVGYTAQDLSHFLNSLNFYYDSGYGGQEYDGIIWYEDGTWSQRGEYDGSEWWELTRKPKIPEDML